MKVRGILFVSCLTFVAVGVARADDEARSVYVIPYVEDSRITVDGSLEDWANVPNRIDVTREDRVTYKKEFWSELSDLSGTIHLAWNIQGIFLAADVTDDILSQTHEQEYASWCGDHVDLRLYIPREDHPKFWIRNQIGFAPFKTDSAGVPQGSPFANGYYGGWPLPSVLVASSLTEKGYIIEAFVPFQDVHLVGFENCDGLLFDVNLSDSDVFPSAQQTMTSFGTRDWIESPSRYSVLFPGDENGRYVRHERELARFADLTLNSGEERILEFPGTAVPLAGKMQLHFKCEILGKSSKKTDNTILAVELNERKMIGSRLVRNPDDTEAGTTQPFINDQALLVIPSDGPPAGNSAVAFALDNLISLRQNRLLFRNMVDEGNAAETIQVSDIRVVFIPDPIPVKTVW
jgi:hypothetical protein